MGPRHLDCQGDPPAGHDPGTNRRRTIFGAIDLATGRFCYQVCRKAVSASFTGFCEHLLAAYPTAPIVVVVCTTSSSTAPRPSSDGQDPSRLLVLHGARYSPHDNPTERIWAAPKAWLTNNPTPTIQGRIRQVHAFFRHRTSAQMLATAAPYSSPWLPDDYVQNFRQAA